MDTMLTRLKLRHQRLKEAAAEGEALIAKCNDGGAPEGDFHLCKCKLKQSLEAFEKELFRYMDKGGAGNIDEMNQDQIKAEDILTTMEATASMSKKVATVRLPELGLSKYNGDRLKWHEFYDRFKANVHQQNLADADKMSYLKDYLTGTALDTVPGLAITNANYTIAIEALEKRFGSKDVLIDAHYTAINNLNKAAYSSESCRSTLDSIERNMRVLEELGEPVNGNHMRALILTKFPDKVIHEHHLIGGDDNSMAGIRKSLERIVTAMERSSALLPLQPSTSSTSTTEALHIRAEARPTSRPGANRKRKRDATLVAPAPLTKKARKPCLFCKMSNHGSAECRKVKTVEARKEKLKDKCLRCLRSNHETQACKRNIACFRCKGDHLLIFCPKKPIGTVFDQCTEVETLCETSKGYTFLQTAVATAHNPENPMARKCRLLLDCGSQRSYITENAAKSLGLPTIKKDLLLIYTFGASEPQRTSSASTIIEIRTKRGVTRKLQVNVVPRITDKVPVASFEDNNVDILADDNTSGEGIDLLIGNDFYSSFMRQEKIRLATNLYLQDTDFGWVASGISAPEEVIDALSVVTYCQCHVPTCPYFAEPDLPLRNIDMKFLWSLESIGITDSPKATHQEEAVKHFNETVQYQNGRYLVKWPWIQYPPELPSNFGLAFGRLKGILKRMDVDTLQEYDTILKEQLDLGVIEVVDPNKAVEHPLHYLPHHMVKQNGKRGRIVYDASAKLAGQKSLNECLYSGPSMLEDLTALLLKFRTSRIGILADVEKAFLQVGLHNEDRDVTRFLWIKNLSKEPTDDNLMYLRFCRVPFGVISSPFLLNATIRHHMSQSNEDLLKTTADRCYVDNLVTGADSVQEAEQVYQQTRAIFEQISMNIRDWVSNDETFMSRIPTSSKADETQNVKVLGLNWNTSKDTLKLKVTESHFDLALKVDTKRKVLRSLARVYDPCGYVCPLVLPMKLLFQRICETKSKWDARLPEDLIHSVQAILEEMKTVTGLEVPRYIGTDSLRVDTKYYLHCFTDASKNAYASVVYMVAVGEQQTTVSFIMAKSHVSRTEDKEDLKIPKLELLGFLIGSRLLKYIKKNIGLEIEKEYLWTDSKVVLSWMKSNKLLPPFVANRVNEIKRNHSQAEMYYVNTKSNPADIATRPDLFKEKKDLWYNGPEFLTKLETHWPENRHHESHKIFFSVGEALGDSPGEHPVACEGSSGDTYYEEPEEPMELCDPELQDGIDEQDSRMQGTVCEIKKLQQKHFPEELSGKKTHLIRNLDLFLDVDGILRCRGRMTNTNWSYDMKYPILLPKDCEFTNKLIKETHESSYHVGAPHTLSIIRERYWIPQGKAQVQKVLRRCAQCIKHGGGPFKLPDTPALPPERVNYNEPFTFTGLDYFGPLYVNTPNGKEKRWVALFTCLTVRAIHLEVVNDMSAEECLLAFRRFVATRGVPKKMYSDNATYFKLTSEIMEKPYCIDKRIQWKFIPQLAPWHGGFYERMVALVKHCLKRTLEKHLINDSKLLTVMKEVEAVINSRPLTRIGTEVEHILRPKDFLSLGKCLTMTPTSGEVTDQGTVTKADLIDSWKRGLRIMQDFKDMFIGQYLASLRERYNHGLKQPRVRSNRAPQIGDLVQIKSDHKNRNQWKVGKIVSLIKGSDGECRVAKVNVEDSILTRSIGHLYPLEADEEPREGGISENQTDVTREVIPVLIDGAPAARDAELSPEVDADETVRPSQESEATATDTEDRSARDIVENISADDAIPNCDETTPLVVPQQPSEREGRSHRDAAVRARAKILEWTRHLLTLLD